MLAAFNTLALLVLLPLGLWRLTRQSEWAFYRKVSNALFAFWFLGTIEVIAMNLLCDGNLLYGLNNCVAMPKGLGNVLAALGLFSMAISAALWILASIVMLVRAALNRSN
ncbi:hypothetical protein TRP8649_03005 [Pelagimonas phthalicica]|uniref:Uncharacterized protein n=1 Tax=Pelagimonas phthalicica TaxID=1037362 RepID=A0A238JDY4_9RHOB|nr:hypothetical protein [Pelagimonas phthalicica]TDS91828.1 hypothetical protein CLV87_3006 [Pelagimonas phthalicica]SMX28878.1 hypothetical protein TRP8649_03005 [Pelagimonas phthalicica]